tara:strand:- start:309 stop:1043 length:735 start_codon:yes stop_codon:yes gene_type:complete
MGYFTVEVKPTMLASKQTLSAYADADVVFDWTAFDIPKGTCKLVDVTVVLRGTAGARQDSTFDFYFAKSRKLIAPASLGTENATASGVGYFNDLLGTFAVTAADFSHALDHIAVASGPRQGSAHSILPDLCLTGEPDSGTNVGYDKLYIAGLQNATDLDLQNTINVNGIQATTQAVLTVQGTHATKCFDVGDVVFDEDDRLMGTIKSVDSTTQLTMESNLANASVDNKKLFPQSPIKLILSFER